MNHVVKNWDLIKGTSGVRAIEKKLEEGEGNGAMAHIGLKLAKRLGERPAK